MCGIADRRLLRRHKLAEGWAVLCANHAAIAGRRVLSLDALRAEVFPDGDRRQEERRAAGRRAPVARRQRVDVTLSDDSRGLPGRRSSDAA